MKAALKVVRFVVALPVAAPLILLSFVLTPIWRPAGAAGMAGLWLLGVEASVQ